jgi:hypothetical protein
MNKWTEDEKNFIINKFKEGKSIEEIHQTGKISRSKFAIECKLYGHIYDMLQNGKSHSNVAEEFNISKKEVKNIEQKMFEMRSKTDTKTMYTNDGGYQYGENKNVLNLNDFHHMNRTLNTVISYYENIDRLNKLKENKTIEEDFYNNLIKKIKEFTFDKQQIINSLDVKLIKENNNTNNSEKECKEDKSDEKQKKEEKEEREEKKSYSKNSEDDDTYVKKYKKRLI